MEVNTALGVTMGAKSQLADMSNLSTVAAVANVYTLDMENKTQKIFNVVSEDANAKEIAITNAPTDTSKVISIAVLIVCTVAAVFTHPATFADNAPAFTTGESYWAYYESIDGGTTYSAQYARRT